MSREENARSPGRRATTSCVSSRGQCRPLSTTNRCATSVRRQRQQPQTQQRVGIKINKTGKMYKKLQQVATVIVATERIATAAQIDPSSSPDGGNV